MLFRAWQALTLQTMKCDYHNTPADKFALAADHSCGLHMLPHVSAEQRKVALLFRTAVVRSRSPPMALLLLCVNVYCLTVRGSAQRCPHRDTRQRGDGNCSTPAVPSGSPLLCRLVGNPFAFLLFRPFPSLPFPSSPLPFAAHSRARLPVCFFFFRGLLKIVRCRRMSSRTTRMRCGAAGSPTLGSCWPLPRRMAFSSFGTLAAAGTVDATGGALRRPSGVSRCGVQGCWCRRAFSVLVLFCFHGRQMK